MQLSFAVVATAAKLEDLRAHSRNNKRDCPATSIAKMGVQDSGKVHTFVCACQSVKVQVKGDPMYQDYCHCQSCCKWNQTRPVAIALFPEDSLTILAGAEHISKVCLANPEFERLFCGKCGYQLYGQHTRQGFKSVPVFNLETLEFKPDAHVFCGDAHKASLLQFKEDGLPKWARVPSKFGGSDEEVKL